MSSMDVSTLDFFVQDSIYGISCTEENCKIVIELLEPFRDNVEDKMCCDFEEEEHSWRDYRNSLWGTTIPPAYDDMVGWFLARTPFDVEELKKHIGIGEILRAVAVCRTEGYEPISKHEMQEMVMKLNDSVSFKIDGKKTKVDIKGDSDKGTLILSQDNNKIEIVPDALEKIYTSLIAKGFFTDI